MLLALPFLCFALIARGLHARGARAREAILIAAVACGLLATTFVEALSIGRWLDRLHLAMLWGAAGVIALLFAWRLPIRTPGSSASPRLGRGERLGLLGLGLIAVVTLITALAAPPNTFDVLVYHMSRVAHWAQNRSVDFYPTHILRQLHQPPGAEYAILNTYLLTGGDRFVNLVAWSSAIGCMIATSAIAAAMGLDRRAQIVTALCTATLPMLQAGASGAKNDVVAAFWLSSYLALALRHQHERQPVRSTCAEAGALALALLTKGTAYLFAPPLVVWVLARRLRQLGWRIWRPLLTTVVVCLVVNGGFFARNQVTYGAPLGPGREDASDAFRYANDEFGVRVLASNVVRNLGLELTEPTGGGRDFLQHRIEDLHAWLGWRIDDPATTWGGESFRLFRWRPNESRAGNPLHTLLLLLASLGLLRLRRWNAAAGTLLLTVVVGFLLFCGLLKWQPWHTRLHLPLLVVAAPVMALVLTRMSRWVLTVVVAIAVVLSASMLFNLGNRSWIVPATADGGLFGERARLYFATLLEMMPARQAAFAHLRREGVHDLGLIVSGNEPEYLLWSLPEAADLRIEHVAVANASAPLDERPPYRGFVPQAVLVIPYAGEPVTISGRRYPLAARYGDVAVHLLER